MKLRSFKLVRFYTRPLDVWSVLELKGENQESELKYHICDLEWCNIWLLNQRCPAEKSCFRSVENAL